MTAQISLEVTGILSVWLETLLYGMYASLFFETVFIILKKSKAQTGPSKIFFGAIIVMFICSTAHVAINLYRLLRGYVWLAKEIGPTAYFGDLQRWDAITHDALNAFTTWVGDGLVIYRCYIVWDNNLPIVLLPIALLIMSIIANSIALHDFSQRGMGTIFSHSLYHWMNTIYALAFVQNTMTTGLIAYRIWQQDRKSQGLVSTSLSLIPLIRIIVESASLYVLNVLILIILYALNSNGQFVAQEAIVPVCGIVFTLITVRLAMHTSKTLMTTQHAGTKIQFAGLPGRNQHINTGGFATLTTDQTTTLNSAKQPVHVNKNAFVSDEWAYAGEREDSGSESKYDVPLEDMLTGPRDEKVNREQDAFPGTAV